jgi:urease accessory protein
MTPPVDHPVDLAIDPSVDLSTMGPTVRPAAPALSATALLELMWLASPALPVGGFSYSEGLEAAVEAGLVTNEDQARDWLSAQLQLSLARSDLAVVAQAIRAWRGEVAGQADDISQATAIDHGVAGQVDVDRITELNTWVRLTRETSELRQQTEQMGRSLLEWLRIQDRQPKHVAPLDAGAPAPEAAPDARLAVLAALKPAPTWPVAHALALARSSAPLREALLAHGFGWVENMVQAALKAVPLGQSSGQRILAALIAVLPEAVDQAMRLGDDERQSHSPMLAILSARHETQYSRLFRS